MPPSRPNSRPVSRPGSRPSSAGRQRPDQHNSCTHYSQQTSTYLSQQLGSRPGSRAASRPSSAGRRLTPAAPSVHMAPGAACGTMGGGLVRALEEELRGPALGPVPASLSTPMERCVAEALGLTGGQLVPRLPLDVEQCDLGGRCCWRWLARAALEHIAGGGALLGLENMGSLGMPVMVASLRARLESDAATHAALDAAQSQIQHYVEEISSLRGMIKRCDADMACLHSTADELRRKEAEALELRAINSRLMANEHRLEKELAQLKVEQAAQIEGEVKTGRDRAERAELNYTKMQLVAEDCERRMEKALTEFANQKADIARLKQALAEASKAARWKRLKGGKSSARSKPQLPSAARGKSSS